jgi:hypothetical protein
MLRPLALSGALLLGLAAAPANATPASIAPSFAPALTQDAGSGLTTVHYRRWGYGYYPAPRWQRQGPRYSRWHQRRRYHQRQRFQGYDLRFSPYSFHFRWGN